MTRIKHPEVVLPDDLEVDEVDVNGMLNIADSVYQEPIFHFTDLRVFTVTRMEVRTSMNGQKIVCKEKRSHALDRNTLLEDWISQIDVGNWRKGEVFDWAIIEFQTSLVVQPDIVDAIDTISAGSFPLPVEAWMLIREFRSTGALATDTHICKVFTEDYEKLDSFTIAERETLLIV